MFIRAKKRKLKSGKTSHYFYMCSTRREGDKVKQYSSYLISFRETNDFQTLRKFWQEMIEKLEPYTDNMNKPSPLYFVYEIEKKFNIPTSISGTPLLDDEDYIHYVDIYQWEKESERERKEANER